MRNFLFALTVLTFSNIAQSEDRICPVAKDQPWDKMEEKAFSKDAVQKQLEALEHLYSGEIEVAEEFVLQSILILEGGYYRMEIDKSKSEPELYEQAIEKFCRFMAERAYLVH